MVIPLDSIRREHADRRPLRSSTPLEQPLEMPVQELRGRSRVIRQRVARSVKVARYLAFGGAGLLSYHAASTMLAAISLGSTSSLQYVLAALFVLTFTWIAFSATSALTGLLPCKQGKAQPDGPLPQRTALLMPVYNEDPAETCAALLAMALDLDALGHAEAFEIFLISDTTKPEAWLQETAAYQELQHQLRGRMPVWYRRRYQNRARKAGNVQEFVERWGGRYEALVVLDADSLMSAETLVALAREMAADPHLGLLQTVPRLIAGEGLLARMQQFAGALYGPAIARGVAAWQGDQGNYWGHNAILRTRALAASCGLPHLPGRAPFGGHVLSHDFVEAALLVRAGWSVRMDPELAGSYEEGPPTLLDMAVRDRRWCQGNLQHAGLLRTSGLAPTNRAHFTIGILSYLASPLWLALITVGVALAVIAHQSDPVYFSSPFQLFPNWPRFDSERMVYLFGLSMGVLLLPKALGLVRALLDDERRTAFGGAGNLLLSAALELFLSALYAPVLMWIQSKQILEILRGKDSGWNTQNRGDGCTPWTTALRSHARHTLLGVGTALFVAWGAPALLPWMVPTCLGLAGSILLSRFSGDRRLGGWLRERGLFQTPEEAASPAIEQFRQKARDTFLGVHREIGDLLDPQERRAHFACAEQPPTSPRGEPDHDVLGAWAKSQEAGTLEEAWQWMSPRERLVLLSDRVLMETLASRTRRKGRPPSPKPA